jgi:hypothetical protein
MKQTPYAGLKNVILAGMILVPLIPFILVLPTPHGMKDVGTEYRVGPKAVINDITRTLYGKSSFDVEQWQLNFGPHHGTEHAHGGPFP